MNPKTKNLLAFAYVVLIACIAIGFLLRTILLAVHGSLFFKPVNGGYSFIDYVAFYTAGKIVLSSSRALIYDPAVQLEFYNKTIAAWNVIVRQIPLGQSVPWFFAFMAPFALLPLLPSFLCWNFVGIGLSALALNILLKQQGHSARARAAFLLGVIGSYPTQWLIHHGQNSCFLLIPLCVMLYGLCAKKDTIAGIGLACMSLKPQYLLFLVIPVLVMRRWKILLSTGVCMALFVALSAMIFGTQTILNYPATLSHIELTNVAVFPTWMISLRGPLSILFPPDTAFAIANVVYVVSLLAIAVFWIKLEQKPSPLKVRIGMAITFLACLLASPHTHAYDFVVFAAIAAFAMPTIGFFDAGKQIFPAKVWCRSLLLLPLISFLVYLATDIKPVGEILGVSFFVYDLWLFIFAVLWYLRAHEAEAEPNT